MRDIQRALGRYAAAIDAAPANNSDRLGEGPRAPEGACVEPRGQGPVVDGVRKPAKNGKGQRQRGDRFERECVEKLRLLGVPSVRVPLSGAAGGQFSGDIRVQVGKAPPPRCTVECKVRKVGWGNLYSWIKPVQYLFIKNDREEPLVVMRLSEFARLARGYIPDAQS